jgi:hypothetical protein
MTQAHARATFPSEEGRADVKDLLAQGLDAGLKQRAAMIEAANAKSIAELEARLKQYEFQEAARLVTAIKMILEAAEGRLAATIIYVKPQHSGFDNFVQVRLHTPGDDIREVNLPRADIFAFTVREKNNIALGRGQQNPREEVVKKPAVPPEPSATALALKRLYNRAAPTLGLKALSLEPKAVAAVAEVVPPTTAQLVDGIIVEASKWCAMRGHIRKGGLASVTQSPAL